LRTAIALASSGDTINFSVSGTINIGTGGYGSGYLIDKSLTIDGSGQSIIINATGITDSAFMFVNGSANSVLRNITVQGNAATSNPLINITANGITIGPQVTVQNNANGSGIQFTNTVSSGSVTGSTIRNNAGSGILLFATGVTIENNTITQNTYEVIKLDNADGNTIRGNYIGVNGALTPSPNNASGIAMTNGASGNVVENNTIAYNQYQNVLLNGSGTNNNTLRNNVIFSGACNTPSTHDNAGIVITNGASSNAVGPGNRIYCHRYDGIQVVGTGTNSNQITDNTGGTVTGCTLSGVSGSVITCNGRGISIINEYNNTDFPSISPSGSSNPNGPNGTVIQRNLIANNRSDGIYAVRSTNITIGGASAANTIQNNQGNGALLVGSSGTFSYNQVVSNGVDGLRVEPHYGTDRNYVNYNDDTVSQFDIRSNTFTNNTGAGIFGLDNEADADEDPSTLNTNNTFSGNGWVRVAQQWFGAVEVLAQNGDPIKGITSGTITSATCPWESRSLQVYNNGAWGPSNNGLGYGPFVLNHVGTWFIFTGDYVANDGTYVNCEPRDISVTNGPYSGSATFSFDGDASTHPVSPDVRIPYSSPNATRNGRYQVAQVTVSQPTVVVLTSFQAVSSGNATVYWAGLVLALLLVAAVGVGRVIKKS
jgi:parallel beta-helix repeat protein